MISKTAIHTLRAMVVLAELDEGAFAGAGHIAEAIQAPHNYLGKLLQDCAREGLVLSQKGHGGGFRLARPAGEITLFEIVEPIDHVTRKSGCLLGHLLCTDATACCVHHKWKTVVDAYLGFLKGTTLADLLGNPRLVRAATLNASAGGAG